MSGRRNGVAGPTGRALVPVSGGRLPVVVLGQARTRKTRKSACPKAAIYLPESEESCASLRIRWLASTCLAGMVGVAVIGLAIFASLNVDGGSGIVDSMRRAGLAALEPIRGVTRAKRNQNVAGLKADRIETVALGVATRHIIHDTQIQKRGEREFITIKPYARIVARLATEQPSDVGGIPTFNPFKLHLNESPLDQSGEATEVASKDIVTALIDLPGNAVPLEDGLELSNEDVARFVAQADENLSFIEAPFAMRGEDAGGDETASIVQVAYAPDRAGEPAESLLPARNTTIVSKQLDYQDEEPAPDAKPALGPGVSIRYVRVEHGETLERILIKKDVDKNEAKEIGDAVAADFRSTKLKLGYEIRLTLQPMPDGSGTMDALKVSIYDGGTHKVTVRRSPLGDYVVSDDPVDVELANTDVLPQDSSKATLYTSFYHAATSQHIPVELLEKLLRVHSYDIDFKQRVRPGDGFELFFDTRDGPDGKDSAPNEILYTAFSVDGETRGFYRFRTPDGVVDYYDENGDSAKRFLVRNPVKGGRFTSGFGMRKHPLLRIRRMHSGVDYAAPPGTPILAAGDGVIESHGRNGGYGNYIRIRHANGFATSYGHMSRYAEGLEKGMRVKQGQVIGYVGTTGISTGPHLHFEVTVNNRFVDPMTIKVPRGLQLQGRLLAEFQKERQRIDQLMALSPVTTRVAAVNR